MAPKSTPSVVADQPVVALDIQQAAANNNADVTRGSSVTILTPAEQWSFAASFPFKRELLPEAFQSRKTLLPKALQFKKASSPQATRLRIRIEVTVRQGRIGFIFVTHNFSKALGPDEERTEIDGNTSVDLVVDNPPESGWIVLRNNAPGKTQSSCVVHSINVYSSVVPAEEVDPSEVFRNADADLSGRKILDTLRRKWFELPVGTARRQTTELLKLDDEQLRVLWNTAHHDTTSAVDYAHRGWYHDLYRDVLRGKRVLDVGSGFGVDGITFAKAGAKVSFLDIAPSNLELLRRLCNIFEVEPGGFHYLEDLDSLEQLPDDFDFFWCQGSMINAPFTFAQREARALLKHLRLGGRWIELAYPRERWERDGSKPFEQWGKMTDGAATPWMEWYDLPRMRKRLEPAEFDVVLQFNFHNNDFNWFDLIRRK